MRRDLFQLECPDEETLGDDLVRLFQCTIDVTRFVLSLDPLLVSPSTNFPPGGEASLKRTGSPAVGMSNLPKSSKP